ncbi:hypothetical protein MRX96_019020 [Rhipicephalus microplus]
MNRVTPVVTTHAAVFSVVGRRRWPREALSAADGGKTVGGGILPRVCQAGRRVSLSRDVLLSGGHGSRFFAVFGEARAGAVFEHADQISYVNGPSVTPGWAARSRPRAVPRLVSALGQPDGTPAPGMAFDRGGGFLSSLEGNPWRGHEFVTEACVTTTAVMPGLSPANVLTS